MGEICFNSEDSEEDICLDNTLISKIKDINSSVLIETLTQERNECRSDLIVHPASYTSDTQHPQE